MLNLGGISKWVKTELDFLRFITLVGGVSEILYLYLFVYLQPGSVELIWDRWLVGILCLLVYFIGGLKNVKPGFTYQSTYILFYLYSGQALYANAMNGFNQVYSLTHLLIFMVIPLSMRDKKRMGMYLTFIFVGTALALFFSPKLEFNLKLFYFITFFIAILIVYEANILRLFMQGQIKSKTDYLQSILDRTADGIFVCKLSGEIIQYNPRTSALLGNLSLDNKQIQSFIPAGKNKFNWNTFVQKVQLLERTRDTVLIRSELGREFWADLAVSTFEQHGKDLLLLRMTDIDESKRSKERLEMARQEAEAGNKAKSEFLATMSHEIRTPMNAVIGLTDLLSRTKLDGEQKEYVSTIQESGSNLLEILNDVLDYSKLEAGRLEPHMEPFDIQALVKDLDRLMQVKSKAKKLKLTMSQGGDIPKSIITDPGWVRQILINLIGNAIKFTKTGTVELIYDISQEFGQPKLNCKVVDTGPGIPLEIQKKLFVPFTQGDGTITRMYGGSGLGLAICKKLAESLGGEIGLYSTPGSGSEFWFKIPVQIIDSGREKRTAVALTEREETPFNTDIQILVVEDNPINQKVIQRILSKLGLQCALAENGQEALDILETQSFDLIFMDIQMPIMDGIEATKKIRKEKRFESVKIIAMTANAFEEDRRSCLAAGMDDYLAKPIRVETLQKTLAEWFPVEEDAIG